MLCPHLIAIGVVHKVRQHFLGGGGSKIEGKLMTDRCKKVMRWGRVVSKIVKKVLTYFMDGPIGGVSPIPALNSSSAALGSRQGSEHH